MIRLFAFVCVFTCTAWASDPLGTIDVRQVFGIPTEAFVYAFHFGVQPDVFATCHLNRGCQVRATAGDTVTLTHHNERHSFAAQEDN